MRCAVEVEEASAAEDRADRRSSGALHDGRECRRDIPRHRDDSDPRRVDPQRSSLFMKMLEEDLKIRDGVTVRVSDGHHA